jgi:hypothetical protein
MLRVVGALLCAGSLSILVVAFRTWLSVIQRVFLAYVATLAVLGGLFLIIYASLDFRLVVILTVLSVFMPIGVGLNQMLLLNRVHMFRAQARKAREIGRWLEAKGYDQAADLTEKALGRLKQLRKEE